jgi:F-type H+-transporting ATPase subunit delta
MPAQLDQVATVYARSLFELATAQGGSDMAAAIGEELGEVCEIARSDAKVREFIASPIVDPKRRGESLRRAFEGRVSTVLLNFLLVINRKGRLAELFAIEQAYEGIVAEAFGRVEVDVFTTSGRVDAATATVLQEQLRKALGKEPVIHHYADPRMIGGVKLRIGDQLVDGSVAAQLRRMRQALVERGLGGRDASTFLQ